MPPRQGPGGRCRPPAGARRSRLPRRAGAARDRPGPGEPVPGRSPSGRCLRRRGRRSVPGPAPGAPSAGRCRPPPRPGGGRGRLAAGDRDRHCARRRSRLGRQARPRRQAGTWLSPPAARRASAAPGPHGTPEWILSRYPWPGSCHPIRSDTAPGQGRRTRLGFRRTTRASRRSRWRGRPARRRCAAALLRPRAGPGARGRSCAEDPGGRRRPLSSQRSGLARPRQGCPSTAAQRRGCH